MTIDTIKNFGSNLVEDSFSVVRSLYKNDKKNSLTTLASSVALRIIGVLSALYGTSFLAKSLFGLVTLNPISLIAASLFLISSIALFIIAHEFIKIGCNLRVEAKDIEKANTGSVLNAIEAAVSIGMRYAQEQVDETPFILKGTLTAYLMKQLPSFGK
jgi:hypothetical protein